MKYLPEYMMGPFLMYDPIYNGLGAREMLKSETFTVTEPISDESRYPNLHITGAKDDRDKPRVGLVLGDFANALLEVSKVGTAGAKKYTEHGWLEVEDGVNRYTDALYRHLLKEAAGEEIDPDFNLKHAAHTAWNALARLELILRGDKDGI